MNRKLMVVWGYFVEILAALLLYAVLVLIFGLNILGNFMSSSMTLLMPFVMAIFAGCIAIYMNYRQLQTNEFGHYLFLKDASEIYATALTYPIYVAICTFIMLLIAMYSKTALFYNLLLVALIYLVINLITLLKNARYLMKLHNGFKAELNRAKKEESKE